MSSHFLTRRAFLHRAVSLPFIAGAVAGLKSGQRVEETQVLGGAVPTIRVRGVVKDLEITTGSVAQDLNLLKLLSS